MKDRTVTEAAADLGMSGQRVRFLIRHNRLKAVKRAGAWFVPASEVERYAGLPRKAGRPVKS